MNPKKFVKFILLFPMVIFVIIYIFYLFKPDLFYFRGWEYFENLVYAKGNSHKVTLNETGDATRKYLIQRYNKLNTISINEFGNRVACYNPTTKKDKSLLMIGESQLFGSGLDDAETLPATICKKYNVNLYNASRKNYFNLLRVEEFDFDNVIIISPERIGIKNYCNLLEHFNHTAIKKSELEIQKTRRLRFFKYNRKYLRDYLQSRLDVLFNLEGQTKAPKDFIRHGVYRIVRHPIYLSNLILLSGVFLISGSAWIVLNFLILFIYYLISAFKEERYLLKKFPSYKKYKSITSMFIPGYKLVKK